MSNISQTRYAYAGFTELTGRLLTFALVAILMGMLFAVRDNVWKFYILPGDALASIVNRCSVKANEHYGRQFVKWRDDHPINSSNPYQRDRDEHIVSCVRADGWCVHSQAGSLGIIGTWGFGPSDSVARWLYDFRYRHGVHPDCF
jgi:hypothetical protein